MRKFILTVLTTLYAVSTFATYNYLAKENESLVIVVIGSSVDWGVELPVSYVTMDVKSSSLTPSLVKNNLTVTTSNGETVYDGLPENDVYATISKTFAPAANITGFKFTNSATLATRYYKNLNVTIATQNLTIEDTELSHLASIDVKFLSNEDIDITGLALTGDGEFTLASVKSNDGYYTATIEFVPDGVKNFSTELAFANNGGVIADINGKGVLASPSYLNATPSYDNIQLEWAAVPSAQSYVLTNTTTGAKVEITDGTSYEFTGLSMGTSYTFTIQSKYGEYLSNAAVAKATTLDLPQIDGFRITKSTYTTISLEWTPNTEVWGYTVSCDNGMEVVIEGGATGNETFANLNHSTEYTFTIAAMAREDLKSSHLSEVKGSTVTINCEAQKVDGITLDASTFSSEKKKDITTDKNSPIVSFSYHRQDLGIVSQTFKLYAKENGSWKQVWSSSDRNGNARVELGKDVRDIRFAFDGTKEVSYSDIIIEQKAYAKVDKDVIDFGDIIYGQSATETVSIDYSSMKGDISTTNEELTVSDTKFGEGDCDFGTKEITVTFAPTGMGEYSEMVSIGEDFVQVKAKVVIPTSVDGSDSDNISVISKGAGVVYVNIGGEDVSGLNILNASGAVIKSIKITDSAFEVLLPEKGLYIFQFVPVGKNHTFKVLEL